MVKWGKFVLHNISYFGIFCQIDYKYFVKKTLENPNQKTLLNLLREMRKDRKLSQANIAERIKKPQSFVSKYESGERRLDILELHAVCKAIGVKLPDFVLELEKRLNY